jgi:hypothetical protein
MARGGVSKSRICQPSPPAAPPAVHANLGCRLKFLMQFRGLAGKSELGRLARLIHAALQIRHGTSVWVVFLAVYILFLRFLALYLRRCLLCGRARASTRNAKGVRLKSRRLGPVTPMAQTWNQYCMSLVRPATVQLEALPT